MAAPNRPSLRSFYSEFSASIMRRMWYIEKCMNQKTRNLEKKSHTASKPHTKGF